MSAGPAPVVTPGPETSGPGTPEADHQGAVDVELRGVTKRYTTGAAAAVDALDLQVRRGEFMALLGPSGCGKTTCLRLVAGFERPDQGSVLIGGRDVSGVPPSRREVNTVFQSYGLFGHLDVRRNVEFGLRQQGVGRAERRDRAEEALALVRLEGYGARSPGQLSGGQQQRVALARALVLRPRVLLLDEPLGALDLQLRKQMQVELTRLHRQVGCTFVFVTHDQGEALSMADRVAVMRAGRIEQLGAPAEVYDHPATPFVASFVGDMSVADGELVDAAGDAADTADAEDSPEAGDGRRVVRTPAGDVPVLGTLPPAGTRVRVGVRPEALRVEPPGEPRPGPASFAGRLLEVAVVGDAVRVIAEIDGVGLWTARRPRTEQDGLTGRAVGDEVRLVWDPADAVVLPLESP